MTDEQLPDAASDDEAANDETPGNPAPDDEATRAACDDATPNDETPDDPAPDDEATNDEATDTAPDDTVPDDETPDDTTTDDTTPDDAASDDTTPSNEAPDEPAPNEPAPDEPAPKDPAPDAGVAPVPRRLSRRRVVLVLTSIVMAIGYIAACGYGGDVLGNDDGLLPNGVLTSPSPTGTSPAVLPVSTADSFPVDRFDDEQGPDNLYATTMALTRGFVMGGERARWGFLTTCPYGACEAEQQQQQQYVDVKLHRDADVRFTARFGVLHGGAATAPVRFEIMGGSYTPSDGAVYDRTLVPGQSVDVNVEVEGWQLEILVTGPLSEVRAGILDPLVTIVE